MELRPGACSIIRDITTYRFNDRSWMQMRSVGMEDAINIYEMHMGSWRMNKKDENGWYQYDEIAKMLVPYLKQNNYTHVELMPLSEHPFDGSWGYQNTGFFAPTKRYGTPDKLMKFVDMMHQAGIGVIMDFVPVHFAVAGKRIYDGEVTEYYMMELHYMNTIIKILERVNGEVATLFIPEEKFSASCNQRPTIGWKSIILMESVWMQ